jgi:hypothetical protein
VRFGLGFIFRPGADKPESDTLLKELEAERDSSILDGPTVGTRTRDNEIFGVFDTNGGCELLWTVYSSASAGTGGTDSRSLPLNIRMKPLFLCLSDFPGIPLAPMEGSESLRSDIADGEPPTILDKALLAFAPALTDRVRDRMLLVGLEFLPFCSGNGTDWFGKLPFKVALRDRSLACACASASDISWIVGEPGLSIHPGMPLGPKGVGRAITWGSLILWTFCRDKSLDRIGLIGEDIPFPAIFDARGVGRPIWRRDEADAMFRKVECELIEWASVMVEIESLRDMFPSALLFGEIGAGSEA